MAHSKTFHNSFFKNTYSILFSLIILVISFSFESCGGSKENESKTGDEVTIGQQVWMTKNLDVDKFQNGDIIPQASSAEEWDEAAKKSQPAWCYYEENIEYGKKFGKLYNWYAVNDPRGLAPKGWHVPSIDEFLTLYSAIGGKWEITDNMKYIELNNVSLKLKSKEPWEGNETWKEDEKSHGTNEIGFTALPGGERILGSFDGVNYQANWWTSTTIYAGDATGFRITISGSPSYGDYYLSSGLSVRCVKDDANTKIKSVVSGDNVTIAGQTWKTVNLNAEKFRNGDSIPQTITEEDWKAACENKQPAWRYISNDSTTNEKYGKIYNCYAIKDSRGIAPQGWHIPSKAEWDKFIKNIGGVLEAGRKLKSKAGWDKNGNGTDEFGFSGLPCLGWVEGQKFAKGGENVEWWSYTEKSADQVYSYGLVHYQNALDESSLFKNFEGAFVRCIKD
jgi:uncharacterized protein (TIGR02145 family)